MHIKKNCHTFQGHLFCNFLSLLLVEIVILLHKEMPINSKISFIYFSGINGYSSENILNTFKMTCLPPQFKSSICFTNLDGHATTTFIMYLIQTFFVVANFAFGIS